MEREGQQIYEEIEEENDAVSFLHKDSESCEGWQKRKKKFVKISGYLLLYSFIFFFASYIMPCYVCGKVTVDGNSMQNTLHDGDHLINEKYSPSGIVYSCLATP